MLMSAKEGKLLVTGVFLCALCLLCGKSIALVANADRACGREPAEYSRIQYHPSPSGFGRYMVRLGYPETFDLPVGTALPSATVGVSL